MQTRLPTATHQFLGRFEHCLTVYLERQRQQAGALARPLVTLQDAMRYSTLNGGKRLRAMLVYLSALCVDQDCLPANAAEQRPSVDQLTGVDIAAIAVELIHCYSLVHDDLPAMDDDDLRRGKPTNHKVFGEANAILAGDALQTAAFDVLSACGEGIDDAKRLSLIRTLAGASGSLGMVGGQVIDLALTDKPGELRELTTMHRLKTGALISCATQMGGICASAEEAVIAQLRDYGEAIGLAFQIRDDLLDIDGDPVLMGKQAGMDQAANKTTFPALTGREQAEEQANTLKMKAIESVTKLGEEAGPLIQLAHYIVERDR